MKKLTFIISSFFILHSSFVASGQSLPVGFPGLEDYYRGAQLLRKIDSTFSFTARPFFPVETLKLDNPFDPDGNLSETRFNTWDGSVRFLKGKWLIQILPQTIQVAYKRPIPLSINDGPMIPARGFQTLYSGGIYTKLGPLSIRFQPEVLYAQNKAYTIFTEVNNANLYDAYYATYNYIDLPERFGNDPYRRYLWGQSSIRLNVGPVSLGLSNENLWWGPGYRNSLLMTNSAPGFKHVTLNSTKPIKTPIGNFEFQLVGGKLDSSGFTPSLPYEQYLIQRYYKPKPHDWRYFNGLVATFMPRWTPGLFFGASRAFMMYREAMGNKFSSYLPVLLPLTEKNTNMQAENAGVDQLASLFVRWLWLKENAELYFEFGREDRSADLRDLILDLSHQRAYHWGIRKFFPIKNKIDQQIEIRIEATQLEEVVNRRTKGYGSFILSWYRHSQIRHGYTHYGQMLGAGIGPGSNMQTLNINWVHGMKRIGFQLERYLHNNDLLENADLDTRRRWVDLIFSLLGTWDYKNFIFTAQIDAVKSINYQWYYNPEENLVGLTPGTPEYYWAHGKDIYSLQALIGITYRF